MKIYLAARYGRRAELAIHAETLRGMGHEVTARWLNGTHEAADGDKTRWASFAQDDVDDIRAADTVVSFSEAGQAPGRSRGGRHIEFGIALALGKRLVVIGDGPENVFHCLPEVLGFRTFAAFLEAITEVPGAPQSALVMGVLAAVGPMVEAAKKGDRT